MSETIPFTLSKAINTHKGEVATLDLKYPTAQMVIDHGFPFSIVTERSGDDDVLRNETRFDAKKMFKFISDMSGVDPISLSQIPGEDVLPLFQHVVAMLGKRMSSGA